MKSDKLHREGRIQEAERTRVLREAGDASDETPRELELSFSSSTPYRRRDFWTGLEFDEVLLHGKDNVDLSRLNGGAPFLDSHDAWERASVIGVVIPKSAKVDGERGTARVRMDSESARADEVLGQLDRLGMDKISVGYKVLEWRRTKARDRDDGVDDADLMEAIRWQPMEISSVILPADDTVGIGRQDDAGNFFVRTIDTKARPVAPAAREEEKPVDEETKVDAKDAQEEHAAPSEPTPAEVLAQERERVSALKAQGKAHAAAGGEAVADEVIESGGTVANFHEAMNERYRTKPTAPAPANSGDGAIGMTRREVKSFSFARAALALAFPNNRAYQAAAAFEREAMQAANDLKRRDADVAVRSPYTIPMDVLRAPITDDPGVARELAAKMPPTVRDVLQRATSITTTDGTSGQNLVATMLLDGSFIDLLRAQSAFLPQAYMLSDLVGNVDIPRRTKASAPTWRAQGGSDSAASDVTFDRVQLSPKMLYVEIDYSITQMLQSSPEIEGLMRLDMVQQSALKIDAAVVAGSGANNEPTGMLAMLGTANDADIAVDKIQLIYSGASAAAANTGEPLTFDALTKMRTQVARAHGNLGASRFALNANTVGKLMRTAVESGTEWKLYDVRTPMRPVLAYPVLESEQLPSDRSKGTKSGLSVVAFGDFSEVIYATWGGQDIQSDPYSDRRSAMIRLSLIQHADIGFRHPSAICVLDQAATD